ncbi:hypothetical protein DI09_52p50 [Mitosporidium daphniae]|uniref:Uncharacterized protein n=1 Tax=Mitosporidium daphniae TaxID=1485682 RepID=A0A098VP83_9MICR|nr:uncharacterized protein DI09_52p50 [Mitosporidium daphniae]KGG50852.1 hypothetical protein DI09_52p50 [Mitosporidium daphniae]|eukprot:XP_013237303.1 uncharacterized protein DI09_52p50 [Mitosporidium daphniae]
MSKLQKQLLFLELAVASINGCFCDSNTALKTQNRTSNPDLDLRKVQSQHIPGVANILTNKKHKGLQMERPVDNTDVSSEKKDADRNVIGILAFTKNIFCIHKTLVDFFNGFSLFTSCIPSIMPSYKTICSIKHSIFTCTLSRVSILRILKHLLKQLYVFVLTRFWPTVWYFFLVFIHMECFCRFYTSIFGVSTLLRPGFNNAPFCDMLDAVMTKSLNNTSIFPSLKYVYFYGWNYSPEIPVILDRLPFPVNHIIKFPMPNIFSSYFYQIITFIEELFVKGFLINYPFLLTTYTSFFGLLRDTFGLPLASYIISPVLCTLQNFMDYLFDTLVKNPYLSTLQPFFIDMSTRIKRLLIAIRATTTCGSPLLPNITQVYLQKAQFCFISLIDFLSPVIEAFRYMLEFVSIF